MTGASANGMTGAIGINYLCKHKSTKRKVEEVIKKKYKGQLFS